MNRWFNNGTNEYYCEKCPDGCVDGRLTSAHVDAKDISKEGLYQYYIADNHSQNDSIKHFNLTRKRFLKLINLYGISKRELHLLKKPEVSTRTHESYVNAGKKSAETQKNNWANKSKEEKEAWSKKMSESHKTEHFRESMRIANKKYWDSPSAEDKERRRIIYSEASKGYWSSLSAEEKQDVINRHFNNGAGYRTANSRPNLQFIETLNKNGISFCREFRIGKFAYDFIVDGKTLIEINPSATHNITWSPFENNKAHDDHQYHYIKSKNALDNGYRCIHIWDWDNIDKIISLLKPRETIYARNCEVKLVDKFDCVNFINQYHLQGYVKSSVDIGLYYHGKLASIMTFGKPRYNRKHEYELIRFCSSYNIVGGSKKLFHYFINTYCPTSIVSYCDFSKFTGETYIKLGFSPIRTSVGKHWYNCKTGRHITDNLLRANGFDRLLGKEYGCFGKGTDNEELMRNFGFVEIMDAGQITYEWRK